VRRDALFGARGEIPMTEDTLHSVWVLDERAAARALSIVHTHQEGAAPAAGPAWRCPACGEELEPQFSACWLQPRCRVRVWGRSPWTRSAPMAAPASASSWSASRARLPGSPGSCASAGISTRHHGRP